MQVVIWQRSRETLPLSPTNISLNSVRFMVKSSSEMTYPRSSSIWHSVLRTRYRSLHSRSSITSITPQRHYSIAPTTPAPASLLVTARPSRAAGCFAENQDPERLTRLVTK